MSMRLSLLLCLLLLLTQNYFIVTGQETDNTPVDDVSVEDQDESTDADAEADSGPSLFDTTEDPIVYLNDITFPPFIKENNLVLVEFVTLECERCKLYLKSYQIAAKILKEENPPIPLVRVNGDRNPKLVKKYQIAKYPTLLYFQNGESFQHHGQRGYDALVEFMTERAKPDWKYEDKPKVIVLTRSNMTKYLRQTDLALVKFYSPNCPVCQKFNLGEEEAANYMEEHLHPHVPYVKVDISADRKLARKYNVTDIPTFKIFRRGNAYDYKDQTDAIRIVAHMREQSFFASKQRNSHEQIEEAMDKLKSTVVGFFTNEKSEQFQLFQDAINYYRNMIPLLHCFDKETMEYYDVYPGKILVFPPKYFHSKRWDPDSYEFDLNINQTLPELQEFLRESLSPVVGFRGRDNADYIYTFRPLVVVYYELDFTPENRETTETIRNQVLTASEQVIGVQFCISHELEFEDELVEMGLEEYMGSVSAVYYDEKNVRHPRGFNNNFIGLDLKIFALRNLAGKLPSKLKSQPIPKNNTEAMKVIVANSVAHQLIESPKSVVFALYSLACVRSETYMPTVETLAKQLKHEQDLIVARMNIDGNEVTLPFKKDILPTIYFLKASDKENPILYEDVDVNLTSLLAFVQKHLKEERELQRKEEL